MELRTFLLIAFVAGAFANPLSFWGEEDETYSSTSCAISCPDTSKFSYEQGKTYQYSYSTNLETTIAGSMDELSALHMTATVNLEVMAPCEMAIRLSDVSLQDADPSSRSREYVEGAWDFKRALQARSMRFAFLDGHIQNVCADPEEEHWVKNLKKGIVSAFQNRMPSFETNTDLQEIDISGECPVQYEISSRNWGTIYIRKTKNVMGCANRQYLDSMMQGTSYRVPSNLQSLPILKGEAYCDQEVNSNGILAQSQCHETHIYRPFSKHESGGKTTVTAALVYQGVSNGIRSELGEVVNKREALLFEHKADDASLEDEGRTRQKAQRVLREICEATRNDIRPEVPALFGKLVKEMRMLDSSNLNALFQVFRNDRLCDKAEKFFRDAIPALGTSASIALIRDLITGDDSVSESDAEVWLHSLTFISAPTLDMIREAKPLLQMEPRDRRAALSISSMVHAFCKDKECADIREIRDIMEIFAEDLRYNCAPSNDDQYDRILMSLKSIGNAGLENPVPALMRCVENEEAPMALRVAAISAFRHMPCAAEKSQLTALLRDVTKDAEIRIMSYLALMKCPDMHVINAVVEILRNEEVNQVGSFMWTHLTNLQESSHVFKQEIREILEDEHLEREFDMDKRKFSRNIEWSAFSEWINVGAMLESNLIWSSKSYVPVAWNLNSTVDMFGESINMLEIGGRMEGVESILERIFNNQGEDDVPKNSNNAITRLDNQFLQDRKSPELSYYMRIFGTEVKYDDFRNIDIDSLKDRFNFLQWLIDLSKEHVFDMTKSMMFLDSTLVVPTLAGVPLKVSVEGNAVMEAKVNGALDLRQIHVAPRSVNIRGSIKPSSAIEISGEMGVDMMVAKTGVKMVNTLHTSTVADSVIELRDGQIFSADFNTPKDKIEVFSAQSKFYLIYRDEEREQAMLAGDRVEHRKCFGSERMNTIVGMELCGELAYPAVLSREGTPFPPLTGPVDAKLELYKRDSTMSGYHFEAKMLKERVRTEDGIEVNDIAKLSFSTPDSQVDREFTIDFNLNRAEKAVRLNLRCPWKKADMTGALVSRDDLKRVTGHVIVDDAHEYGVTAEVQIDDDSAMKRYSTSVEITVPSMQPIRMGSTLTYKAWKRLSFDLNMENLFDERLSMSLNSGVTPGGKRTRYTVEGDIVSPILRSNINGFINAQKNNEGGSGRVELDYTLPSNAVQDRMTWSFKFRDEEGKNSRRESSMSCGMTSARYPWMNGDVSMSMEKTAKSITTTMEAGPTDARRKRATLSTTFTDRTTDDAMNYAAEIRFAYPDKRMDYTLNTEQIWSAAQKRSMISLQYTPRKSATVELGYEIQNASPFRASCNGRLEYPGREWILTETIEERAPREFHHNLALQFTPDDVLRVTSMYKDQPRYEMTSEINIPAMNPITIAAHLKPEMRDLQTHLEFRYDNYLFSHTGTHQGPISGQFDTTSSMELGYPSRLIQAAYEAHKRGETLSGSWEAKYDASRDASKKVKLSGELTLNSDRPAMTMRTEWYPSQFVEVTTSGTYQHDGWWSSRRNMQGDLSLTSSFRSMREVTMSLSHNQDERQCTTHTEITTAPGKTWVANFNHNKQRGWSQVDATFTLEGPNRASYSSSLNYNIQGNQLTVNHECAWNGERLEFALNGNADLARHSLDGSVSLRSPFRGFEDLALTARHNDNGRTFDSEMEAHMNGQRASAAFTMQHARRSWYITNSGSLTVQTPFSGYRTNKLIWNHENNENVFTCHHEIQMERGDTVLDISASKNADRRNRNVEMTASFTSPFEPVRDIRATFSHSDEVRSMENIITSASFQWAPSKTISIENELHIDQYNVRKSFVFTSPFRGYERITMNVNNALSENRLTMQKELIWGNNQRMALDGHITVQGSSLESHMEFVTPFRPVERVVMNLNHNKDRNVWVTTGDLSYDRNSQIQFTTKLGIANLKKLSLELQTPFESMTSLAFDIEHRGSIRDFTSRAMFDMQPEIGAYSLNARMNANDIEDMRGSINIETPIRKLRFMRMLFTHQHEGRTQQTSELSFEMPRYSMSLTNALDIRSIRDFTTNTQLTYMEGRTIQLETAFALDPSLAVSATFRSPFRSFEEITFEINHEGQLHNFRSNGHLATSPSERFAVEVEYNNDGSNVNGRSSLTTPPSYDDIVVVFGHQGDRRSFRSNGEVSYGRQRYAGNANFNNRRDAMNGEFSLSVPSLSNDVTGSFSHEMSPSSMSSSYEFNYPGRRYIGSASYDIRGDRKTGTISYSSPRMGENTATGTIDGTLNQFRAECEINCGHGRRWSGNMDFMNDYRRKSGSMSVSMPYRNWEDNSASFSVEGSKTNFRSNAEANINGQRMGANAELNIESPAKTGSITITTPLRGLETSSASFTAEGGMTEFRTTADASMGRNRVAATAEMDIASPRKTISATLNLPIRGYESNSLSLTHTGGWYDFSNEAILEYAGQRLSANNQYSKNTEGITLSSEVRTPFPSLRTLIITGSHSGKWKSFTNAASFSLNGQTYSHSTTFKLVPKNSVLRLTSQVNTPGKDLSFTLNHRGGLDSCTTDLDVTLGRQSISGNTELTWNDNRLAATGRLTTPFRGHENFQATINHRGDSQQFRSSGSVTTPYFNEVSYEMNHRMTPRRIETSGNVQIPQYPRINFELNHSNTRNEINTITSVSYDERSIGGNINIRNTDNGFEISGTLQTPCQVYRQIDFELRHSGSWYDFSNSASISSNGRTLGGSAAYRKSGDTIVASWSMQTPVSGFENMGISLNHDGTLAQFTTTVSVDTPFRIMPSCTVTVRHSGSASAFEDGITIEYNNKRIEGSLSHSFESRGRWYGSSSSQSLNTRAQLTTSYPAFNFDAHLEGRKQGDVANVNLDITYKGRKIFDGDYTLDTGATKSLTIKTVEPRRMTTILRYTMEDPTFTAHAEMTYEGSSYVIDVTGKNQVDAYTTDRALTFNIALEGMQPIMYTVSYMIDSSHFTSAMNYNDIYTYSIEANKVQRRNQHVIDASWQMTAPGKDYQIVLSHTCVPGRSHVTEMTIGRTNPVTIRHELTMADPDYTVSLTINSPLLSNPIHVEIAGTIDLVTPNLDGRITLAFDNENIVYTGKIAQESTSALTKYVASTSLTHPGTFTDMSWTSFVEWDADHFTFNQEASYQMTRDRTVRTGTMNLSLNKPNKQIIFTLTDPIVHIEYNGQITEMSADVLRGTVSYTINDQTFRSEVALIKADPSADIKVYYGDNEVFHIHLGYPDDRSINLEAYHTRFGERIQDAQVALSLASSRILQTRVFLRPAIKDDLAALYSDGYGDSYLDVVSRAVSEELRYKQSYARRSFQSIMSLWDEFKTFVEEKYTLAKNKYDTMYYNNDYHIRDIVDKLEEYKETIENKIHEWEQAYERHYYVYAQQYSDHWNSWRDTYSNQYNNMYNTMYSYGQTVRDHANTMHTYVTDMYSQHATPIINNQYVQRVISISSSDYLTPYYNIYEKMVEKYEQTKVKVNDLWRQVQQRPEYIKAREWVMQVIEHSQWWYEYLEIEEMIEEKIQEIRDYNFDTLKTNALTKLRELTGLDRSRFTVWNPRGGEIAADIYLPVEMTSLRELPTINYQRYINKIKNMIRRYMPASDFCFWDKYYEYKPSSDIFDWVPPFKAHATILGSQFFYTFDHHFFEYSGECSYLLARDFIDGNFSVVVNYDNVQGQMTKKSITVSTEGHDMELYPDFKVLLDGNRVEMPVALAHTSVVREGNLIKMHNDHGLDIECNLPYDSCTIGVSGWYYSKTAGLLGTYNNEHSDDFLTPDHTIASSPEALADSWTVGRRCRVVNNAHIAPVYAESRRHQACAAMFESTSSAFRPCFKQVEPEPFMKMCLDKAPSDSNSLEEEEDVCQASSFYVKECKRHGVPLRMPHRCVKCELSPRQAFYEPQTVTIAEENGDFRVPDSADIVFVVSHGACNLEVRDRLAKMITLMEKAMKVEELRGNQYALLGYGGEGVSYKARPHTMDGKIFNNKAKFIQAIGEFQTMDRDLDFEDTLSAVREASALSFRPGVSKTIILIPCATCQESQQASYSQIQQVLSDRDIRLHVILDHEFTLKASSPKTSFIFGVDRNSMYNAKHVGQSPLTGDAALRAHVNVPKDICAALAEETDGSVFNVNKLTQSRIFVQKKFMDIFSRLVAKKAEPTDCQKCECIADEAGVGKSMCRRCHPLTTDEMIMPLVQEIIEQDETEEDLDEDIQEVLVPKKKISVKKQKKLRQQKMKNRKNKRRQQ